MIVALNNIIMMNLNSDWKSDLREDQEIQQSKSNKNWMNCRLL